MAYSQALPRTVDAAYGAVDPDVPLEPGDPRYVNLNSARGDESLPALIARRIRRTPVATWHRQLVTGHRGSGKSTELKCLQGLLDEAGFLTVYLDVEQTLDLADVEYLDLLVAVASGLDEAARAVKLMQTLVHYEREIGHPDAEAHAAHVAEIRARMRTADGQD